MERKIYKTGILMLLFLMLLLRKSDAQDKPALSKKPETAGEQKDYQQKMKNLQQNMRDLQTQVTELQQQHTKEILKVNAENMKIFRFKNLESLRSFVWVDSVSSLTSTLADNVRISVNGLTSSDFLSNGTTYKNLYIGKGKQTSNLIEKTKTYSKSYSVGSKDKLIIDNQYGKVTVNTWNKKEFKVDVEIRVGTADEAETQKLLDGVDIVSTQDQSGISFKTSIPDQRQTNNLFGTNHSNSNRSITINYTVFMPVKNALDITNKFGAVILPDLEGPLTIRNTYGSFTAKELSNTANNISLRFGNANIDVLNGGNLNFQYGNLKIGTANNLNATMGFSPVNIERLKSSANIKVQYGSGLKIDNLDKNLKNLDIDASFANVSLDLNGSENFLFDVTVKHNQFNYNDNRVKVVEQPENDANHRVNFVKNYKGYVGKSGSDNKVVIKSNYQRVNFN